MVVTNMQHENHKTSPQINKQHKEKYQNTQTNAKHYGQIIQIRHPPYQAYCQLYRWCLNL